MKSRNERTAPKGVRCLIIDKRERRAGREASARVQTELAQKTEPGPVKRRVRGEGKGKERNLRPRGQETKRARDQHSKNDWVI